ncbi:MAG: hypothetical protein U5K28_13180 [Halobacteriales archaeon]|nr:hypothetical protein [Halobacteriales archaeon]
MSDDPIEQFVQKAERAFEEYDKGYADPDATLRKLRSYVDELKREREK